jgi:alpha-tubulin suppressor-like RCC1 family protein
MFSPSSSVFTFSTIVQVSAGVMHTCARYSGGNLACWGRNTSGELGNYTVPGDSSTPLDVLDSNGFILNAGYVGSGAEFSCSRSGSFVYCWGSNTHYQLATTTVSSSLTPVLIPGTYSFLSVGERHACGLSSGSIYCWGNNQFGRLGIGNTVNQYTPSLVNLVGAADVQAGGTHTCARMTSGQVSCWGRNADGQLGNGSQTDSSVPVTVLF